MLQSNNCHRNLRDGNGNERGEGLQAQAGGGAGTRIVRDWPLKNKKRPPLSPKLQIAILSND
jgi:hypothetical protein